MHVAISVKSYFKIAGTLRVPFANVSKSQADGTWKVPATLSLHLNCSVPERGLTLATAGRETSSDSPSSLASKPRRRLL